MSEKSRADLEEENARLREALGAAVHEAEHMRDNPEGFARRAETPAAAVTLAMDHLVQHLGPERLALLEDQD